MRRKSEMSQRCGRWSCRVTASNAHMGKTRMQARSARTRTLALTHDADAHVHRASASNVSHDVLMYARGNRRRLANESGSGNENGPINPHDVGSVLSHDRLMGEVFCTRSDHPETMTLNFPP
jgi:hypothetical protein